jgi:hypothetical protein
MKEGDHRALVERFQYHPPRGDQQLHYEAIRRECLRLAMTIVSLTPESREQSRALAALDDVMFNANAAIARHERWELRDQWVRVSDASPLKQPESQEQTQAEAGRLADEYDPRIEREIRERLARSRDLRSDARDCAMTTPAGGGAGG